MYRDSVVIDKILTHLDEKDALAEPLVLPQSRAPLSALRNCIPYGRGKALICLLSRNSCSSGEDPLQKLELAEITRSQRGSRAPSSTISGSLIPFDFGERSVYATYTLPHHYPFLMVDWVVGFEGDSKCTGVKQVTINEPYFHGHYSGHRVMTDVLQIEAMAQIASIVLLRQPEYQGKIGYFMRADKVRFRKPVMPGDTLFIEGEILKTRRSIGYAKCRCMVNGEIASEGELKFAVVVR